MSASSFAVNFLPSGSFDDTTLSIFTVSTVPAGTVTGVGAAAGAAVAAAGTAAVAPAGASVGAAAEPADVKVSATISVVATTFVPSGASKRTVVAVPPTYLPFRIWPLRISSVSAFTVAAARVAIEN